MDNAGPLFSDVVETVYNLSLEERLELKSILEHNIADARREEILSNFKKTMGENEAGKLTFSSNIDELKEML